MRSLHYWWCFMPPSAAEFRNSLKKANKVAAATLTDEAQLARRLIGCDSLVKRNSTGLPNTPIVVVSAQQNKHPCASLHINCQPTFSFSTWPPSSVLAAAVISGRQKNSTRRPTSFKHPVCLTPARSNSWVSSPQACKHRLNWPVSKHRDGQFSV